jgi:hypothetical protein
MAYQGGGSGGGYNPNTGYPQPNYGQPQPPPSNVGWATGPGKYFYNDYMLFYECR